MTQASTSGRSAERHTSREKEAAQSGTRPLVPGLPTRVVDSSGVVKRQKSGTGASRDGGSGKSAEHAGDGAGAPPRLFIGEGVSFNGRVTTPATLVVGGRVSAELTQGNLEVLATGRFDGRVVVDRAVISGRFEGQLTARKGLTLTETARVRGRIRYGSLEVAPGGEMAGDVDVVEADVKGTGAIDQPRPDTTAAGPHTLTTGA